MCLPEASHQGGVALRASRVAAGGGQRKPNGDPGTSRCCNWLNPFMQLLKSAKQKSNYSRIMRVEAQGEGTVYLPNYERWGSSQSGAVAEVQSPEANVSSSESHAVFYCWVIFFLA